MLHLSMTSTIPYHTIHIHTIPYHIPASGDRGKGLIFVLENPGLCCFRLGSRHSSTYPCLDPQGRT